MPDDTEGVTQREFQRALDVLKDSMRKMEELAVERDVEIKRRLTEMNGHHAEISKTQAQSVPRELYERDITTAREALGAAMESNRKETLVYRDAQLAVQKAQDSAFEEYKKAERENRDKERTRHDDAKVTATRFNIHAVFGYGLALLMALFTIWQAMKK